MGKTADEIEHHIERTRDTLGSNLQELEHKVKAVTDWKHHFQKNPMTMIGMAFGGGVLLASMLGGRKGNGAHHFTNAPSPAAYPGAAHLKHEALETWDNVKGALIGLMATRFKDYVSTIVPGFTEQFDRTQEEKTKLRTRELV